MSEVVALLTVTLLVLYTLLRWPNKCEDCDREDDRGGNDD
jgi:hypothetical protein